MPITHAQTLGLAKAEDARLREAKPNPLCHNGYSDASATVRRSIQGHPGGASRARSFIARSVIAAEIRYERRPIPSSGSSTQRDQQ